MSELAVVVQVSPQAISLATRELERLKIVVRVPDSADRRRIWIELTELGRQELAPRMAANVDSDLRSTGAGISTTLAIGALLCGGVLVSLLVNALIVRSRRRTTRAFVR
jgi:DNA-binding MarR family transcriptional regulator